MKTGSATAWRQVCVQELQNIIARTQEQMVAALQQEWQALGLDLSLPAFESHRATVLQIAMNAQTAMQDIVQRQRWQASDKFASTIQQGLTPDYQYEILTFNRHQITCIQSSRTRKWAWHV